MNRVSFVPSGGEIKGEKPGGSSPLPVLLSILVGILLSLMVVPGWLPGLVRSMQGDQPTAFWLLSRASALVSFGLLWLSMLFGLLITSKTARLWPGSPTAFDLHEHTSLLGLLFALLHALLLLGDQYIHFHPLQLALPFASTAYRTFAVGLGQLAFYAWVILVSSFYLRKKISQPAWRALHWTSFLAFILSLVHGITAGTDSSAALMMGFYWTASGSILFLFAYKFALLVVPHVKKR